MNLREILELTTGLRHNHVAESGGALQVRGYVPQNLPAVQYYYSSPPAFVPGFSHGGALHAKKRKRKKTYRSELERDVHDVLVRNDSAKRQKVRQAARGRDMETFLRDVHAGQKRPPEIPLQPPPTKRVKPTAEAYEPDVSAPAAQAAEPAPVAEEEYEEDEDEVAQGMAISPEEAAIMQPPAEPGAITEEEAKIQEPPEYGAELPPRMPDQPSAEAALGTIRETAEVQELSKMFDPEEQDSPAAVEPEPAAPEAAKPLDLEQVAMGQADWPYMTEEEKAEFPQYRAAAAAPRQPAGQAVASSMRARFVGVSSLFHRWEEVSGEKNLRSCVFMQEQWACIMAGSYKYDQSLLATLHGRTGTHPEVGKMKHPWPGFGRFFFFEQWC